MAQSETITVRPVAPQDQNALAHLWQTLVDYHTQLDERLPHTANGAATRYAERLLWRVKHGSSTRAYVAELDGQVVGYVLGSVLDLHPDLFEQREAGFIADLFVLPAYRRRGIARRLVATINAWFAEQGMHIVEWSVAAANVEGLHFWEALGGQPIMVQMRATLDDHTATHAATTAEKDV